MKIIGEKGLRAFTVAQIAQEVGIKDGTIFRHFKNKDEIVDTVLDRLEEVLAATVPPENEDPLERLAQFVKNRIAVVASQPGIQALLVTDDLVHAGGHGSLARVGKMRKVSHQFIHGRLHEAKERGLIRPEVRVEDIAVLLHGTIIGLVFMSKSGILDEPLSQRAGQVLDTLISSIRR